MPASPWGHSLAWESNVPNISRSFGCFVDLSASAGPVHERMPDFHLSCLFFSVLIRRGFKCSFVCPVRGHHGRVVLDGMHKPCNDLLRFAVSAFSPKFWFPWTVWNCVLLSNSNGSALDIVVVGKGGLPCCPGCRYSCFCLCLCWKLCTVTTLKGKCPCQLSYVFFCHKGSLS